jgi:hypothetical protein
MPSKPYRSSMRRPYEELEFVSTTDEEDSRSSESGQASSSAQHSRGKRARVAEAPNDAVAQETIHKGARQPPQKSLKEKPKG